jgi:hypothetical protein
VKFSLPIDVSAFSLVLMLICGYNLVVVAKTAAKISAMTPIKATIYNIL